MRLNPTLPGAPRQKDQRISSHEFSAKALADASVETVVREYRGNVRLVPAWRGLITAQLHGGRIVR